MSLAEEAVCCERLSAPLIPDNWEKTANFIDVGEDSGPVRALSYVNSKACVKLASNGTAKFYALSRELREESRDSFEHPLDL
jgi:hypothetical protein